jgi:hypothetical protein
LLILVPILLGTGVFVVIQRRKIQSNNQD